VKINLEEALKKRIKDLESGKVSKEDIIKTLIRAGILNHKGGVKRLVKID
jgi:hypothetical protein